MSAREGILQRLRQQARHAVPPTPWQTTRQFEDLPHRFEESLKLSKGEVIRVVGLQEALEVLDRLVRELGASHVVLNGDLPDDVARVVERRPDLEWFVVGRTAGDLRAFCAVADVGISGGTAALAETGTVVIESGQARSRLATLLPPVHVVLLPESRLTTDLFTWVSARRGPMPAALTLVSGPSKSADIEQTLAVGVHGPKRFIVVLYDDSTG